MKLVNWTITRLCLAGGLMLGTVVSQTLADEAAGAVRISKPRQAASVEQSDIAEPVGYSEQMPAPGCGPSCGPACGPSCGPAGDVISCQEIGSWTYCDGSCNRGSKKCRFGRGGRDGWCDGMEGDDGVCPACGRRNRGFHGHHGGGYCHDLSGQDMLNYFHCKFGYFCPSGNGGKGTPWFGCYTRVYPQDVNYFDGRDGQLFSAQGYGVPIAVPLAPVVGHTYNYGWGIPSSRLTPISRPTGY